MMLALALPSQIPAAYAWARALVTAHLIGFGVLAYGALSIVEFYLPRSKFKANSIIEGFANIAKTMLLTKVPGLGIIVSKLATKPDTGEASEKETPSTPPPPAAILLPFLIAFAIALPGCPGCTEIRTDLSQIQKQCASKIEGDAISALVPDVTTALISNDYQNLLGNIVQRLISVGISNGPELVKCTVAVIDGNQVVPKGASVDPAVVAIKSHSHAYLGIK